MSDTIILSNSGGWRAEVDLTAGTLRTLIRRRWRSLTLTGAQVAQIRAAAQAPHAAGSQNIRTQFVLGAQSWEITLDGQTTTIVFSSDGHTLQLTEPLDRLVRDLCRTL